jgi:hypothetical protein
MVKTTESIMRHKLLEKPLNILADEHYSFDERRCYADRNGLYLFQEIPFELEESLPFEEVESDCDLDDDPYPNSGFKFYRSPSIQTLGLNDEFKEEDAEPKKGFWRRQFGPTETHAQRKFDWMFGVFFPVICFAFDPIVFNGGFEGNGDSLLSGIKPFVYLLSYTSIISMIAWLLFGRKLKWLSGVLAGLFAVGGVTSLALGIVLFPFSLIGLLLVIGALGFTPLLTSIAFLRNSARAYRSAKQFFEPTLLKNIFAVSALFSAVIPYVFQVEIRKGLATHLAYLLR